MGVGWGGVGHVNVRLHLRHEVDATSRMGLGLGGVGWGMLRFACTCVMKLMLLGESPKLSQAALCCLISVCHAKDVTQPLEWSCHLV